VSANLFIVRKAQSLDASAVSVLEQQCVRESQGFRGSAELLVEAPFVGNDFDEVLNDAGHLVLVVEYSGEMCGFADMEISDSVAMVRRVYISEDARELGAGATLINELRVHAKALGCTRIDAYALPGDRLTKNLFERAGMKARLLIASSDL
jgi:N-acetylglutamate synthase-like GNAT family acetyltransferase